MKLNMILLYGNNMEIKRGEYDPDEGIAFLRGRKHFRKGIVSRFIVDQQDIFYLMKKGKSVPYVIIDRNSRRSVKPVYVVPESNNPGNNKSDNESEDSFPALQLYADPDPSIERRLDYLSEKSFWKSFLEAVIIPPRVVVAYLLAGAGTYAIIRMLFAAAGFNIP
ncbi:hypothetical protein DRO69_00695 [Candidatus Bathyarchaeota archaeon]|nr:MAG: hypothetical protein DRO69_00695 [Candidatus Bathyarchaeota archaeon]